MLVSGRSVIANFGVTKNKRLWSHVWNKLTPNRALVNTQLGYPPHLALVNAQWGFLTPNWDT